MRLFMTDEIDDTDDNGDTDDMVDENGDGLDVGLTMHG